MFNMEEEKILPAGYIQGVRLINRDNRPKKGKEKGVYGNTLTKSNRKTKRAEVKEGQGEKAKEV